MMDPNLEELSWDAANRRFRTPDRCPYPDCGKPVNPTNTTIAALAWCPSCNRPYEAVRASDGDAPVELYRRPQSAFSTHTGQPLAGYSLLDWCEAGGSPGRSNSLDDGRGAVFGPPDPRVKVSLREAWVQPSILAQPDPEDHVCAVAVVRGQTVAISARGRIGIFDAVTGEPRLTRPLEWPDGSTDPMDIDRAVRHSPAFRGTRMALAAPHQAQFRDLRSFLLGGEVEARYRLVEADARTVFLGPPLGIDTPTEGFFCLLQGRPLEDDINAPVLRLFGLDGEELRRCELESIVRPPLFDRGSGSLIWVDKQGIISMLTADQLLQEEKPSPTISLPATLLHLRTDDRPTLISAPDANRHTELWVSSELDGQVILYKCVLDDLREPGLSWTWDMRDLGKLGPLSGIAVGIGSRYRDNASGQLLAVATSEKAALFQRFSSINTTHPMQGLEIGGARGSFDPPLISSAGVIARLQGMLTLDNQGIGWNDAVLHPSSPVPGVYDRSQGIAMFGRQVYIGHGLGVRSYRLQLETATP
ncbi:MAG TPA: hypothetical protein VLX28_15945 [Thermoanaerobaculia bacterium]|nr:hypothetical protein [Thermoanaerobaculia bacterium]